MGEGQEKVAREKNNAAFITGGWLVLQNCHLGINYMNEVEERQKCLMCLFCFSESPALLVDVLRRVDESCFTFPVKMMECSQS